MTTKDDRPVPGRHNMYHAIHRGLRLGHARLLERIGATDFADPTAAAATVAAVREFLALARGHLDSEETFIHPAVEARDPSATAHAHEGHEDHERAFDELAGLLDAIAAAPDAGRTAAGQALYARYARFAADDLHHMDGEETVLLGAMHRLFSDDELRGIEGRIVSAADPAKMMGYLRLIVPAISPPERLGMLAAMRAAMPAAAFAAVMDGAVHATLAPEEAAAIAMALAQPAAA